MPALYFRRNKHIVPVYCTASGNSPEHMTEKETGCYDKKLQFSRNNPWDNHYSVHEDILKNPEYNEYFFTALVFSVYHD